MTDHRREAIATLERKLAATPRVARPREHALLAYQLGLAYAETPREPDGGHLRRALACFAVAAEIFDPAHSPVEHARTLLAAGSARRGLGETGAAVDLFARACGLLDAREGANSAGAAHNDLGLALLDLGDGKGALESFAAALDRFDAVSEDGRRGRAAALHNRGLALAARGGEQDLREALGEYAAALDAVSPEEAPLHTGLAHHSAGVAAMALAEILPPERLTWLRSAVGSFEAARQALARHTFPVHHAVTTYDLGLAWLALGDPRRALVGFEDALLGFDVRTHRPQWQQAYTSLSKVEAQLAAAEPGRSRADHFVALAADLGPAERAALVAGRLHRLLEQPDPVARARVSELALAVARAAEEGVDLPASIIAAVLTALMEIPGRALELALEGWMAAHNTLAGQAARRANEALERAIGEALGGPQRVLVRDRLTSLGYERP